MPLFTMSYTKDYWASRIDSSLYFIVFDWIMLFPSVLLIEKLGLKWSLLLSIFVQTLASWIVFVCGFQALGDGLNYGNFEAKLTCWYLIRIFQPFLLNTIVTVT